MSEESKKAVVVLRIEVSDEPDELRAQLKQDLLRTGSDRFVGLYGIESESGGNFDMIFGTVISCVVKMDKNPGQIYFIHSGGVYKIGRSKDPSKRLRSLATGSPYPVQLRHCLPVEDMSPAEQWFHQRFAAYRMSGEWFRVTDEQVSQAIFEFTQPAQP